MDIDRRINMAAALDERGVRMKEKFGWSDRIRLRYVAEALKDDAAAREFLDKHLGCVRYYLKRMLVTGRTGKFKDYFETRAVDVGKSRQFLNGVMLDAVYLGSDRAFRYLDGKYPGCFEYGGRPYLFAACNMRGHAPGIREKVFAAHMTDALSRLSGSACQEIHSLNRLGAFPLIADFVSYVVDRNVDRRVAEMTAAAGGKAAGGRELRPREAFDILLEVARG